MSFSPSQTSTVSLPPSPPTQFLVRSTSVPRSRPGPSVYPPQSPNDLRAIILAVLASDKLSTLNKSSILYYLALSCAPSEPDTARDFAHARLLPPEFALSVRAFHALDSEQYDLAIRLLADPRVRQPDFVSKTIKLLACAPGAEPSRRHELVLAYWRLTGLALEDTVTKGDRAATFGIDEAELVVRALCDSKRIRGVGQAWDIARQWRRENEIERLMRAILAACFGGELPFPLPFSSSRCCLTDCRRHKDNYLRSPIAHHLRTLLTYPFTSAEMSLLTAFCVSPPSSIPATSHTLAADWFLSLLISSAKPLPALVFYQRLLRANGGKLEPSGERERLLKTLEATLTTSQRTALAIEIASLASTGSGPKSALPTTSVVPVSSDKRTSVNADVPPATQITQPAWVPTEPVASTSTPSNVPATPVRTLAAARQSKLPPAPAPTPQLSDLPLSASPFVRRDGGVGQGVLKALREQQQQGGNNTNRLGSPAAARFGTPVRSGALPASSSNAVGRSQYSESVVSGVEEGGATPVKPTLAGFGSVRRPLQQQQQQQQQPAQVLARSFQEEETDEGLEDEDEDQVMLVPSPRDSANRTLLAAPPVRTSSSSSKKQSGDDFSRRIALDPAIQKTLLAAASSSAPTTASDRDPRDSSNNNKTPKRTRGSSGTDKGARDSMPSAALEPRAEERGDSKRTAVSNEPPASPPGALNGRDKPDQGKTVKLPPGAFPGMDDQDVQDAPVAKPTTATRRRGGGRASSSQPEMRERAQTTTTRRSTVAIAGRRSTRSRSTSVAPEEHDDDHDDSDGEGDEEAEEKKGASRSQPTPRRNRSSRASSLQPPEMSEVTTRTTPVRRSSRLSNTNGPAASTTATTTRRTTRRGGQRAIEEEE